MRRLEIRAYEDKCTQNCPPACVTNCPVHVNVKSMIKYVQKEDFDGAVKVFQKSVPFPRIISRICNHPCQDHCKRDEIGGSIRISQIEKACTTYGNLIKKKIKPFRKTGKKIGIIGGGLSGLTAALFLYEKGHEVCIYEQKDYLGGQIWNYSEDLLPRNLIYQDFEIINKVDIHLNLQCKVGNDVLFSELLKTYDAVYLGTGDLENSFGIDKKEDHIIFDFNTRQTNMTGVFVGGSIINTDKKYSPIASISDGRRAAISIDRYVKKVSLLEGRVNEGAYKTQLFTNTTDIENARPIKPKDEIKGFNKEEAVSEALRCIQCECMECVKECKFLEKYESYPKKYVREIANNVNIMMGIRQTKHLVNSCTFCGLCEEICPNELNMGDVCASAQAELVSKNAMSEAIHDFPINDMLFSNSEYFNMFKHQPGMNKSKYLFYPGCQLSALEPIYVLKSYKYLINHLNEGVGLYLGCCGAPAQWSGRIELFKETINEFKNTWINAGKPIVITACSTCNKVFKEEIHDIDIISIWEIYDKYGLEADRIESNSYRKIAVHDACTARYETKVQQSIRNILSKKGFEIEELKYSGKLTKCCGYGGLVSFTNKPLSIEMVKSRIDESDKDYVVYCAMCKDYFTSEGKTSWHMFDVIYDNIKKDEKLINQKRLTFSQRHENRTKLKQLLLKELWGMDMNKVKEPFEELNVQFSQGIEDVVNDRLILTSDIQKVIYNAENTNNKVFNPKTGHYTAKLRPGIITYWVEYSIDNDVYTVHKAYSHRLEINRPVKENEHRKYSL